MQPEIRTTSTAQSAAVGSFMDGLVGMLNVFVDPATTARRVPSPYSWLWPVAVLAIGWTVFAYLMMPFTLQLMDATLAKQNVPAERLEATRGAMHTVTSFTTPLTPLIIIGVIALLALLVKVVYGIMDVRPRFRDVFSLLACCSIISLLQYAATYFVLKMKGDPIESPEQLTPPFGPDIFLPNLHGTALAFVGFFSIFELWFILVLVFGLAALTKSSKLKAFFASTPAWLLPLVLRIVGSLFQRPA